MPKSMPWVKRKRAYAETGTAVVGDGFAVPLDGRPLMTPQGRLLLSSTPRRRALATEIAATARYPDRLGR